MTREESIGYIDNLHKKILSRFADKVSEKEMQSFCMAIEALKQPERVHAHWIHTGVTNVYGGHQHECSICGYKLMVSPMCDNENYCCNCGAIMDEEE